MESRAGPGTQSARSSLGLGLNRERPRISPGGSATEGGPLPGPAPDPRDKVRQRRGSSLAPFSRTCGCAGLSEYLHPGVVLFSFSDPQSCFSQLTAWVGGANPVVPGRAPESGDWPERRVGWLLSPSRRHHCSGIAVTPQSETFHCRLAAAAS